MNLNINSNFFNSMLGTSSGNSNNGLMGLLSDYNSIRNGSYLKLAKHYYSNDSAKQATQKKFSNKMDVTSEDEITKTASESAWKAITTLRYEKQYETDDASTVAENVKKFVGSYNNVIESAQKSDSTNVVNSASRLVSQTKNYANALEKIGITVKGDNTLSLDEDVLASADVSDIKKLFSGDFSYGSNTENRLLQLMSDASGNSVTGLYNTTGGMTGTSVGSIYDSLF